MELLAVDISEGSTNCPLAAPVEVTIEYNACDGHLLQWDGVFIADVAGANQTVPVFPVTQPSGPVAGGDADREAHIPQCQRIEASAVALPPQTATSEVTNKGASENDEVLPSLTYVSSPSVGGGCGDQGEPKQYRLTVRVDGMDALFSGVEEKYLLQVGLLQLRSFRVSTDAVSNNPGDHSSSGSGTGGVRIGEVNFIFQVKRASAHNNSNTGNSGSAGDGNIPVSAVAGIVKQGRGVDANVDIAPSRASLTRYLYSPLS